MAAQPVVQRMLKLNTGAQMPQFGFGTWSISSENVGKAVEAALDAGYRHLDCASIYENEASVGVALSSWLKKHQNVKREDIFVTSKLWCSDFTPAEVEPALRKTLKDLQLDYVDLYLMHWPVALQKSCSTKPHATIPGIKMRDTWAAMEAIHKKGLARAIGVSNWNARSLLHLVENAKVRPAVNQVELHPLLPQHSLVAACKGMGVVPVAYSPLGSASSPLLQDELVVGIAAKHGCTPAQTVLSWALKRNTAVIPRSANPGRIRENCAHFADLDNEEMKVLDTLVACHGRKELRVCDPIRFWGLDIVNDYIHIE